MPFTKLAGSCLPNDYQEILKWQWEEKIIPYWKAKAEFARKHAELNVTAMQIRNLLKEIKENRNKDDRS
jgi:hypothetical protein